MNFHMKIILHGNSRWVCFGRLNRGKMNKFFLKNPLFKKMRCLGYVPSCRQNPPNRGTINGDFFTVLTE